MGWRGDTNAERRSHDDETELFCEIRRVLVEERRDRRRALDEDDADEGLDVNHIVTYILRPVELDVVRLERGGERVLYYSPGEGGVSAKPVSVEL